MSKDRPRIRPGDVFWIPNMPDENGVNQKPRAFVVYSEEEFINKTGQVYAVAVSSHPSHPPGIIVPLPWHSDKTKSTTGFTTECWAICRWLRIFSRESLPPRDGFVRPAKMELVSDGILQSLKDGVLPQPYTPDTTENSE